MATQPEFRIVGKLDPDYVERHAVLIWDALVEIGALIEAEKKKAPSESTPEARRPEVIEARPTAK